MRVRLKGLNWSIKRLADGSQVTYWYAWRGGPKLPGQPGSPEFLAAYNAAIARQHTPTPGTLVSVLTGYQKSAEYRRLAERTRKDYAGKISIIERAFGTLPVAALTDKCVRGEFKEWRDELAVKSPRQADYAWSVLALILAWGLDRGLIDANPCEKGGRVYHGTRRDKVWSAEDEASFMAKAPAHMHLPFLLAVWTGQRQGDLLRLPWAGYDGQRIRLRQGKTGKHVVIPVGKPLKAALDAAAKTRQSTIILLNSDGRPWTEDGFRSSWGKACAKAGVTGLTFHDLRGTAVTRLALAHATLPEMAELTGHSMRDAFEIINAHYLGGDLALAESAIRKLEKQIEDRTDFSN